MQGKTLVKLAIAAALAVLIWKKGVPWWNEHHSGGSTATAGRSSQPDACVSAAASASETWGSGIGRFANPPYDVAAWGDFRARVDQRVQNAVDQCSCGAGSCTTARSAMRDLRSLVSDLDSSIRGGTPPPSDIVQRQEAIDNGIDSARDLAGQGIKPP